MLRSSRDRLGAALTGLLVAYMLVPLALGLVPAAAPTLIARFHLRSPDFATWAVLQPSPWMYNFENRYRISDKPLSATELARGPQGELWPFINHQTARVVTFFDQRANHLATPGNYYLYLWGAYQTTHVLSAYQATVFDPPSASARPVRLVPLEIGHVQ